eukprot:SAG31_NODE_11328_length_1042_cov_0.840933_2_plen_92_part_00
MPLAESIVPFIASSDGTIMSGLATVLKACVDDPLSSLNFTLVGEAESQPVIRVFVMLIFKGVATELFIPYMDLLLLVSAHPRLAHKHSRAE